MNNMELYNKVRAVPKEALKPITAGRLKGMSDINPMWRIEILTEVFGACGFGWYIDVLDKRIVEDELTKQKAAFVDINLYVKDKGEWSKPIFGTGGSSFVAQERNGAYLSDECFKMALTDAISIAAKNLGVGADVWFKDSHSKYTQAQEAENALADVRITHKCADCGNTILPYFDNKGKEVNVEKHCKGSMERFGKELCISCIRARNAGN